MTVTNCWNFKGFAKKIDKITFTWETENVPSTDLDDITDATVLGIPEFSTIVMPMVSVLLIVGNRIRNKKRN